MTRRIKATQHYHHSHQRRTAPRFHPDGDRAFAALAQLGHLVPALATYPEFRCTVCDVLIEPGMTAFQPITPKLPYPTICYNCGVGWELFNERLTPDQAIDIPAIGGPVL